MNCNNCWACNNENYEIDMELVESGNLGMTIGMVINKYSRFIVCPECGNKRCPKANHHENKCTGSNEPGQKGSAYK